MSVTNREPLSMDEYRAVLKKHSLKATPQRLAVHKAMLSLGHACADQIKEKLDEDGGVNFTVASIYNILAQMSLLGVYSHRFSANNKMYFDVNTYTHMHLYDTVNNEFKDIIDEEVTDLIESKIRNRRYRGFKVDGIDIQIICHPSGKKTTVR